jgi:hypothetical protein
LSLSLVPLWIFLLMGDNFIGIPTESFLWIKSFHSESQWNKFNLVYPIGLFLSLGSLLVVLLIRLIKKRKTFGYGILWFSLLSLLVGIILMFQHYPRHWVISFGHIMIDIKQYIAILLALWCFFVYRRRKNHTSS